jgi:hypothetical protein
MQVHDSRPDEELQGRPPLPVPVPPPDLPTQAERSSAEPSGPGERRPVRQMPRPARTTAFPGPDLLGLLGFAQGGEQGAEAGPSDPSAANGAAGRGSAAGAEEPQDLTTAWGAFLGRWLWDLFGNHTFRDDVHPEAAAKRFRLFISILNRKLYGPRWHKHGTGIRWVAAMERQARGVVHFHSLLGGSPELVELMRSTWKPSDQYRGAWVNEVNGLWDQLAGFAKIEVIDSPDAVRGYVSKYVIKGGEIELGGPGMPEEKREGQPARVDLRWWKTALARGAGRVLLGDVATIQEIETLLSSMQVERYRWHGEDRTNCRLADRRQHAALLNDLRLRVLAAKARKPITPAN